MNNIMSYIADVIESLAIYCFFLITSIIHMGGNILFDRLWCLIIHNLSKYLLTFKVAINFKT